MSGNGLRQVALLSGKGGTGKTTLAAALACLSGEVVVVDADVDAANLALVLPGEDGPVVQFSAGVKARVDPDACEACGACFDACRFGAILPGDPCSVRTLACEGCLACGLACPAGAVRYDPNVAGSWQVRRLAKGWLVHGSLGIAQSNSGRLVALLREQASGLALEKSIGQVLVDGPPGVGCPVHAALTGVGRVVVVTEPSVSGRHDLERILGLARHFGVAAAVVINKHDLSADLSAEVEALCASRGVPVIGHIPFDPQVPRAMVEGKVPTEGPVHRAFGEIHQRLLALG